MIKLETIFRDGDLRDLGLVSFGGLCGGSLQPVLAGMTTSAAMGSASLGFYAPVLGIASAGISTFVLANSKTDNKLRLLFFSLLCGLAFPAVLANAVNGVSSEVLKAQAATDKIVATATSDGRSAIPVAAATVETALKNNPAANLPAADADKLQAASNAVVDKIAADATLNQSQVRIEELKQIGIAARDSGHDGTALKVTQVLSQLKDVIGYKDSADTASNSVLNSDDSGAAGEAKK